jgi:cell division protein ZipA
MNELRWILIGFGMVLLAAIYLWGRRGSRTGASDDAAVRVRPEPSLHAQEPPVLSGRAVEPAGASDDESSFESEPLITAARPSLSQERSVAQQTSEIGSPDRGRLAGSPDTWRGRLEPTFADAPPTEELPVRSEAAAQAPTLSSSESPQPRRIERRKILALRLAVSPQRLEGGKLLEALQAESLQHGKYDVFHRMHEDGVSIVFSVASMVEPGTFDLEKMPTMNFPGVTLFAQLPGPAPGMHALNELVACARKLQQALGGTLQDDRGVPLTVHRIERLRQEVREFERPSGVGSRPAPSLSS